MHNCRLAMKDIFGQTEAETCATSNHHLFGDWGNIKKKHSKMFSSLTRIYPSITASRTWEPLVNLSLPAQLTSCYIRGSLSRICWTGKYYLCSNTHLSLFMSFRQETILFKATKETVGKSLRRILVLDPILLIISECPKYLSQEKL